MSVRVRVRMSVRAFACAVCMRCMRALSVLICVRLRATSIYIF